MRRRGHRGENTKTMKIIPSECGSRTEQSSETGSPELAQRRATAAKKGEQSVERRQNRPEPMAKKEKKNPKRAEVKTTERRDAGRRQRRQTKK